MEAPFSRRPDVEVEAVEPACGFTAFLAGQRGIGLREAEQLIEYWLERYEPSSDQTLSPSTETDDVREAGVFVNGRRFRDEPEREGFFIAVGFSLLSATSGQRRSAAAKSI